MELENCRVQTRISQAVGRELKPAVTQRQLRPASKLAFRLCNAANSTCVRQRHDRQIRCNV